PFFEEPEIHGIVLDGAFPNYAHVYPVPQALLDRLVYRFSYRLLEPADPELVEAHREARAGLERWREAAARKAGFSIEDLPDGGVLLRDSRLATPAVEHRLAPHEAALLRFLDEMKPIARAVADFARTAPGHHERLGGDPGI